MAILDAPTHPLILGVGLDAGPAVAPIAPSGLFPPLLDHEIVQIR